MMDLKEKIGTRVNTSEFDAILVFGQDNVQYLSGVAAPFIKTYSEKTVAILWPKDENATFFVPNEWAETIVKSSRIPNIVSYDEKPNSIIKKILEIVTSKRLKIIGIDELRLSASLHDILKNEFKGCNLISCDNFLRDLRIIKTPSEIRLLEKVAYAVDHGIFAQAHHVLVRSPRSEMWLSENIRVHCMERGLDVVGGHSLSQGVSGVNARKYWAVPPFYGIGKGKDMAPGEYVRLEAKYSMKGYWSDGARLLTMGEPTLKQKEAYESLVALRQKAVESIRPGVKCSEIFDNMQDVLRDESKIIQGTIYGHGIGVSDFEPPYISKSDNTVLEQGMVLVLEPTIRGPEGEILFAKDTVVVTENGCSIIGWYKNWDYPYVAVYTF